MQTNDKRRQPASKRQRGRGRKPGGQNHHRSFDSNGPSVKIRGSASQISEKYQAMARDANLAGDRIAAENYLQHAEHYYRLVRAAQANAAQQSNAQAGSTKPAQTGEAAEQNAQPSETQSQANTPVESSDDTERDVPDAESEPKSAAKPSRPRRRRPAVPRKDNGTGGDVEEDLSAKASSKDESVAESPVSDEVPA